ncbi:MAG: hypothetical protein ABH879_02320 [archaeon]
MRTAMLLLLTFIIGCGDRCLPVEKLPCGGVITDAVLITYTDISPAESQTEIRGFVLASEKRNYTGSILSALRPPSVMGMNLGTTFPIPMENQTLELRSQVSCSNKKILINSSLSDEGRRYPLLHIEYSCHT